MNFEKLEIFANSHQQFRNAQAEIGRSYRERAERLKELTEIQLEDYAMALNNKMELIFKQMFEKPEGDIFGSVTKKRSGDNERTVKLGNMATLRIGKGANTYRLSTYGEDGFSTETLAEATALSDFSSLGYIDGHYRDLDIRLAEHAQSKFERSSRNVADVVMLEEQCETLEAVAQNCGIEMPVITGRE